MVGRLDGWSVEKFVEVKKRFLIISLILGWVGGGGQGKTDKDDMGLGHMSIIPFPVLCKCRNVINRTKTTKTKCKDN